ncbi:MAG: hypothetical protein QW315_00340 [Candidatus Hadarchaeum sp.]|uniref:hypothetical protein n=1 Tax=Candidatus Hadarchaeum sp. TaxID=2883567 RepID=UPI00317BDADC
MEDPYNFETVLNELIKILEQHRARCFLTMETDSEGPGKNQEKFPAKERYTSLKTDAER